MKKRILLYDWHSNSQPDLQDAFTAVEDMEVYVFSEGMNNYEEDEVFQQQLEQYMKEKDIQICFSFDYFPVISRVCAKADILYMSWVYDSPHTTLYSKTLANSCNLIFSFDRQQVEEIKKRGIHQVFHMPLAVNTGYLDTFLTLVKQQGAESALEKQYGGAVSFVGSMYEHNYYEKISYLPPKLKGYIQGICQAQKYLPGMELLYALLEEGHIEELQAHVCMEEDSRYEASYKRLFCDLFLAKYISSLERKEMLRALGSRFPVVLYSESRWGCEGVELRGTVSYRQQMPLVFWKTKLNLNFSIRSIGSGIPLRCLDIMGAGGALLSNYQPELLEYFEEGREFIGFGSREELLDKAAFYLEREDIRQEIARRGSKKVREEFTYTKALEKMIGIADTFL